MKTAIGFDGVESRTATATEKSNQNSETDEY
jgi:hypothetical protein